MPFVFCKIRQKGGVTFCEYATLKWLGKDGIICMLKMV